MELLEIVKVNVVKVLGIINIDLLVSFRIVYVIKEISYGIGVLNGVKFEKLWMWFVDIDEENLLVIDIWFKVLEV